MRAPSSAPHLLILGHVTRDEADGEARLGGAASYAAQAAARLGIETALVTVAPVDDPLLAPLRQQPRLTLKCVPDDVITTFAVEYRGAARSLALRRRARALAASDIPPAWLQAPVAYVGPVAGECDRALVQALRAPFVGVGLQGWLRAFAPGGEVQPAILPEASAPPAVQAAVLSEADHAEAERIAGLFAAAGAAVAVTRGARGATLLTSRDRIDIPSVAANEIDPTGAGDVFGVVFTVRLAAGASLGQAGAEAARAAARVVEGPGMGRL